MPVDGDLDALDELLKALRVSARAVLSRGFDPEVAEMEQDLERARMIVANVRVHVGFLREQLG